MTTNLMATQHIGLPGLKAKEICERVLQQKDSSEGKINCYNLLNQINSQFTSVQY